jgi:hypothetical protein
VIKKLLFLLTAILFSGNLHSQFKGDSLFNTEILHEIRLEFKEDNFWDILMENYAVGSSIKNAVIPPKTRDKKAMIEFFNQMENAFSKSEIEYLQANVLIDGTQLNDIGVRLKGYSSFFSAEGNKKSIKLDFNEINDTLNYDGIKKVNLNNGVGDPSMQRDFISYHLLRKAGIAAPRVAYAKVYLNDMYWGLYTIIEQIDKTFLENNFASGKGNLYKTIGWSELEYINNKFESYAESIELKTNEDVSDGSDFVNLVKSLNKLKGKEFADSIQKLFFVDYYFKILAIDIISKNWDSYIEHGRNFYLYHEPVSDLFYWIPWDYNLAWDGNFPWIFGVDSNCNQLLEINFDTIGITVNCSIEASSEELAFVSLTNGDNYLKEWSSGFGTDSIITLRDTFTINDKGIYNMQVSASYNNGCYKSKTKKLYLMDTSLIECKSLLNLNRAYKTSDNQFNEVFKKDQFCCNCQWDNICESLYSSTFDTLVNDWRFPIEFNSSKVLINKLLTNDEYKSRYLDIFKYMLDSVFIADEITKIVYANADFIREAVYTDTNYQFSTYEFENDVNAICKQQFYITSLSRFIQKRKEGLDKEYDQLNHDAQALEIPLAFNDIVINEFVANASADNNKGADWIELYNNTQNIIPLNGIYISDDFENPRKFSIPKNTVIKPDGFVIIWADNENKKNGLHANFKLSASGEEIILYHDVYDSLDFVTFEAQYEDSSLARFPNGIGIFRTMVPTLNRHNVIVLPTSILAEKFDEKYVLFPNPAKTQIFINPLINWEPYTVTLYNSLGVKIIKINANGFTEFDVSNLESGIYTTEILNEGQVYYSKVIIAH